MKSLHLNGEEWDVSRLGEQAILLKPNPEKGELKKVHELTRLLEAAALDGVIDIVPAYKSLALVYKGGLEDMEYELDVIEEQVSVNNLEVSSPKEYKVPVCYDLGIDWEIMEDETGLDKEEIIRRHEEPVYTVAMLGFVPGFIYLSGLDFSLACARKPNPRTAVPPGSVGIAGTQTGIYSLESPGGWQVIGRTPLSFFDPEANPPSQLKAGDLIRFSSVSEEDFAVLKKAEQDGRT